MDLTSIEELFNKYMNEDYFSGGVCYVSQTGKKIYHEAFGMANVTNHTKFVSDTICDIASVTKIVTTTIMLKLISQGIFSLSTKLAQCLPQVRNESQLAPITIYQLLTHSSGLKDWYPFYADPVGGDLFSILRRIELLHTAEEKTVYSDLNFILLGEILKYHFACDLESIVEREIKEPLNLESLTYYPANQDNIAATEYGNKIEKEMCRVRGMYFSGWRSEDVPIVGQVNDGNTYYFFNGMSGHAGLFSNVKDIAKIGELYLKGGVYQGKQFINTSLIQKALKKQIGSRCLGWEQSSIFPMGVGHTGFTGTAIWIEPQRKISVGLFTNRLHVKKPKNINAFRTEIFNTLCN